MRNRIALVAGLLLAFGAFAPNAFAGTHGAQASVHPFVDCVTQGSGSYDATFGYTNDNSTAQTVVVGTDNYVTPPPIDRGQTTIFQPGTVHNAFTIKAIPTAAKLTWTVSVNGHSESVNVSSSARSCAPASSGVIHVYVDCVTKNATSYDATFAYANDNAAAQTIPVGANNFFSPLPVDRGQTTTFQPGLHHAAFTVTGIPLTTKLAWTVTFGGTTRTVTASTDNRSCAPSVKPIALSSSASPGTQGSFDATFGYENDNATAQTIPVGADNFFSALPIDRGQTTTFQPGKVQERVHGEGDSERNQTHLDRDRQWIREARRLRPIPGLSARQRPRRGPRCLFATRRTPVAGCRSPSMPTASLNTSATATLSRPPPAAPPQPKNTTNTETDTGTTTGTGTTTENRDGNGNRKEGSDSARQEGRG